MATSIYATRITNDDQNEDQIKGYKYPVDPGWDIKVGIKIPGGGGSSYVRTNKFDGIMEKCEYIDLKNLPPDGQLPISDLGLLEKYEDIKDSNNKNIIAKIRVLYKIQ